MREHQQSPPTTQGYFAQMRGDACKSISAETPVDFGTARLPSPSTKSLHESRLMNEDGEAATVEYTQREMTSAFVDTETTFHAIQSTEPAIPSTASGSLFTADILLPSSRELSINNANSPKIVQLNFATTEVDQNGQITFARTKLLRNIQGFPVDLEEIKTIPALNSILLAYFADTLSYYGLSLAHLSGFAAAVHSGDGHSYRGVGPASSHESWRRIYDRLVDQTTSRNHCLDEKCNRCKYPPFVFASIDESALSNAFLSRGVNPAIDMEFLDGFAPVLNAKLERSGDQLQSAYMSLKYEAANGPLVKALVSAVTGPYQYNIEDQRNSDGVATLASQPAAAPAPLMTSNDVLGPVPVPGSLKRSASPISGTAPSPKKTRTSRKGKAASTTEKERDWTKATPRPIGTTKLLSDTCLTCIQQNRICGGTTLTDKGKCQNCDGVGPGYKKRVCYWKDEDKEILTYSDAQAKLKGRKLASNTREGVAARKARKEASSTATIDPVQSAQMSNAAFSPSLNNQSFGHFPHQYTPTSMATTIVGIDYSSPAFYEDDSTIDNYMEREPSEDAFTSSSHSNQFVNNQQEYDY